MKKAKKKGILIKFFATLGVTCAIAGATFTTMYCVPQIHDKIWTPTTETTETTDDTTTGDTTKTA